MEFHEIIRGLREDQEPKLTQRDFGQRLHASQKKISRLERGEVEPSLDDIRMLCLYYHVSADYLLGLPQGLDFPARGGRPFKKAPPSPQKEKAD